MIKLSNYFFFCGIFEKFYAYSWNVVHLFEYFVHVLYAHVVIEQKLSLLLADVDVPVRVGFAGLFVFFIIPLYLLSFLIGVKGPPYLNLVIARNEPCLIFPDTVGSVGFASMEFRLV